MPYTEQQKKEHIRELQSYLYAISMFDKNIPQILPDGVYDADTRAAVEAFQRTYGLPVTGDTDSATWNRIAAIYRDYLDGAPAAYHVFPSRSFTACIGDSGEVVYITDEHYKAQVKDELVSRLKLVASSFEVRVIAEIPKNEAGKTLYAKLENK